MIQQSPPAGRACAGMHACMHGDAVGLRPAQVEILSEGDFVNELLILVGGMVEVLRPGADAAEELLLGADGHSSLRGTCIRCRRCLPGKRF